MLNIQARQVENATILDLEGDVILGGGSGQSAFAHAFRLRDGAALSGDNAAQGFRELG